MSKAWKVIRQWCGKARVLACVVLCLAVLSRGELALVGQQPLDPTQQVRDSANQLKNGPKDWGQWLGSPYRNNVLVADKIPLEWDVTTGKNVQIGRAHV